MDDNLDLIIEAFLAEETLSKGSQRVMANKGMVSELADAVRDDALTNPHNFPAGVPKTLQKAKDEEVATWFLGQLDKIEKAGYEGTIYARDGQYNEWLVRRYIAGSHNWEDLIGVMNMNLRDWTLLKNRGMLQTGHTDVPKFNSVRDIGKYMSTHYHDKLKDIRDAAEIAAVKKQSKTAKLVDNDDYKIYTVFNWAGARTVGQGSQWCTANSQSDVNYKNYAGRSMLYQVFPKEPEEVNKEKLGKMIKGPEKYQFDPGSDSFMDISDSPANREHIKTKFPYLLSDLVKGLSDNKEQLQSSIDELADDPAMSSSPVSKVQKYNIDDEIKKLKKFGSSGYFTDKVRPAAKPETPPEGDAPPPQLANEEDEIDAQQDMGMMGAGGPSGGGKYPPGTAPTMPESKVNKGTVMENVDKDVAAMLESLKKYDILKESVAPVIGMKTLGEKKGDMPPWLKDKKEDEVEKSDDKEKIGEGADSDVIAWMKRFAKLGDMKGYGK